MAKSSDSKIIRKIFFEEDQIQDPGYEQKAFDPRDDRYHKPTVTPGRFARGLRITLRKLNRLRRMAEARRLEYIEKLKILKHIYGSSGE